MSDCPCARKVLYPMECEHPECEEGEKACNGICPHASDLGLSCSGTAYLYLDCPLYVSLVEMDDDE